MTKEMIFERLMAGEDATVIGNELVAMLNEAVKEKEVADEAKRKEEEAKAWQMKDAEMLADVMNDYFKKYCGATEDMVNAEGLVAAADDLAKMLKVVDKIGNSVNEIKAIKHKANAMRKRFFKLHLIRKQARKQKTGLKMFLRTSLRRLEFNN